VVRKFLVLFVLVIGVAMLGATSLHAQAVPSALRPGSLEVGATFAYTSPDYAQNDLYGFGVLFDANYRKHWGVEAMFRDTPFHSPAGQGISEANFGIGPRYFYIRGRYIAYAKVLGEINHFHCTCNPKQDGSYLGAAIGGGLDIRLNRHWGVRAIDYEYAWWNFKVGYLTPWTIDAGVKYRF
jgi:hypothetical protein